LLLKKTIPFVDGHYVIIDAINNPSIPYHHLIMTVGMGQRVLINNTKPQEPDVKTAVAVNLEPDKGFKKISDL
jgi:hypothetical protein